MKQTVRVALRDAMAEEMRRDEEVAKFSQSSPEPDASDLWTNVL